VIALGAAARNKLANAALTDSTESIEATLERLANTARTDSSDARRVEARKTLFMC